MVCVLYIGGSMGTLAWLKLWVANPSFNSGKLSYAFFLLELTNRMFDGGHDHLYCCHQGGSIAETARNCPHRYFWV